MIIIEHSNRNNPDSGAEGYDTHEERARPLDTDVIVVFLERCGWVVIAVLMSMVEIAPIKINPWSAILKFIGSKLNGEL